MYHLHTRSRSVNNGAYRDESVFYQSLAQKISENLLYYVDGKPKVQKGTINNKTSTGIITGTCPVTDETSIHSESHNTKLNPVDYNFPPDYKFSDDEEYDSFTLPVSPEGKSTDFPTNSNNYQKDLTNTTSNTDNILIKMEDINPGSMVYLCNVCGNYFPSLISFDEHEINNHPNVFCSYIEIEYNKSIPINLLRWHHFSPTGLLKSCKVPTISSSTSEPSIKCTKCHSKFSTASELYDHILDCSKSKSKSKPPSSPSPSTSTSKSTIHEESKSNPESPSSQPVSISPSSPSSSPLSPSSSSLSPSLPQLISPTSTEQQQPPSTTPTLVPPSSQSPTSSIITNRSSHRKASKTSTSIETSTSQITRRSNHSTRFKNFGSLLESSLTYNTRSSQKKRNHGTEMDNNNNDFSHYAMINNGLEHTRKRIRKARYQCPNCPEIFSHHLSFGKHRNLCHQPKDENTSTTNTETKEKPSNSSSSSCSSSSSSSSSSLPPKTATTTTISQVKRKFLSHRKIGQIKRILALRKPELTRNQKCLTRIVTRRASHQCKNVKDQNDRKTRNNVRRSSAANINKSSITFSVDKIATRATAKKLVSQSVTPTEGKLVTRGGRTSTKRSKDGKACNVKDNNVVNNCKNLLNEGNVRRALKLNDNGKIVMRKGLRRQSDDKSKNDQSTNNNISKNPPTESSPNNQPKQIAQDRPMKRTFTRRERRCPSCLRVFKYTGNFRKHVTAGCPVAIESNANNQETATVSNNEQSTVNSRPDNEDEERSPTSPSRLKSPQVESTKTGEDKSPSDLINNHSSSSNNATNSISERNDCDNHQRQCCEKMINKKDENKVDPWKVKQEYSQYAFKGSPSQHHSCPYCKRGFTYLANFRRHTVDECPVKHRKCSKIICETANSNNNGNNNADPISNSQTKKMTAEENISMERSSDPSNNNQNGTNNNLTNMSNNILSTSNNCIDVFLIKQNIMKQLSKPDGIKDKYPMVLK